MKLGNLVLIVKGICTVGAGVTKSYTGLLVCRFLVGAFEAGLIPCMCLVFGTKADTEPHQLVHF
jgi:hypothetical protein